MNQMSFPAYFAYVNTAGKITARSMMETIMVCLTYLEEQEKKNAQYEALLEKPPTPIIITGGAPGLEPEVLSTTIALDAREMQCPECGKVCKSEFGLKGHLKSHNKQEK